MEWKNAARISKLKPNKPKMVNIGLKTLMLVQYNGEYHNGNIKLEVNYKDGEMHGLRTEWYKSGHKWSEQVMEGGYVVSGKHFYNDGSEITHGNIINRD